MSNDFHDEYPDSHRYCDIYDAYITPTGVKRYAGVGYEYPTFTKKPEYDFIIERSSRDATWSFGKYPENDAIIDELSRWCGRKNMNVYYYICENPDDCADVIFRFSAMRNKRVFEASFKNISALYAISMEAFEWLNENVSEWSYGKWYITIPDATDRILFLTIYPEYREYFA